MISIGKYIVILDSDIRYATAFADYLNKTNIFEYTLQVFTEFKLLLQFIHTERIAFALVQEENYESVQAVIKDEKIPVICLMDSKESCMHPCCIFKYQSMHAITDTIKSIINYQTSCKEDIENTVKEQIITIVTPSGSIECAVYALAVANYLSKKSMTLYVNLNPISCLEYLLWKDSPKGLSDILYYYRQGMEYVLKEYSPFRRIENLIYIPQVEHYSDLFYLVKGDMEKLLKEAKDSFDCKIAVVCIKEMNECTETIISKSSQVIIECGDSKEQRQQYERLVTMLKQKGLIKDNQVIPLPNIDLGKEVNKDYNQIVFNNSELNHIVATFLGNGRNIESDCSEGDIGYD